MSNFDLKLIPKAKEDITKYINFQPAELLSFKQNAGKIIYINTGHPGKHIYSAYYVHYDTAILLTYEHNGRTETPMFTIDELNFDAVIGFYTPEEWEKYAEEKRKAKAKKTP